MPSSGSFRELRVWQEGMKLALQIYRETEDFPKHELYGLTQQMRRAAVSVPSNFARVRGTDRIENFRIFCFMPGDH